MTIYSYPVMHFERDRNFNVNSTANGSWVLNIKNIYLLNLSTSLGGKKLLSYFYYRN